MFCRKWMKIWCLVLVVVLCFSMIPSASASSWICEKQTKEECIVFSGLSTLADNESLQKIVIDAAGNEATIGIRRVSGNRSEGNQTRTASGDGVWQVWYSAVVVYAEFYMTVSNNRVKSVYDDKISIIGGSYSDASLTKTSTYGKLSFKLTGIMNITNTSCWLKGTVTGEDNNIEVTWQM